MSPPNMPLCQDMQAEQSRDANCSPDRHPVIRLHQTQPPCLRLMRRMLEVEDHQQRDMEGSCIYRRDCEHLRDIKPILRHPYLTDTCSDTHIKVASQPLRTARSSLQTPARRFQLRPISTALQPAPASCTNDDGIQVGAMVAPRSYTRNVLDVSYKKWSGINASKVLPHASRDVPLHRENDRKEKGVGSSMYNRFGTTSP